MTDLGGGGKAIKCSEMAEHSPAQLKGPREPSR